MSCSFVDNLTRCLFDFADKLNANESSSSENTLWEVFELNLNF